MVICETRFRSLGLIWLSMLSQIERCFMMQALERTGGQRTKAAALLGNDLSLVSVLFMKKYDIGP